MPPSRQLPGNILPPLPDDDNPNQDLDDDFKYPIIRKGLTREKISKIGN